MKFCDIINYEENNQTVFFYENKKDNTKRPESFTAIDFETADVKTSMPCQIGLVVVKNKKIVHQISRLIQPPSNKYCDKCISIHGITPKQTENSPQFPEVWNEIKQYIDGSFIVAHNASFDMSVLNKALSYYNIEKPQIEGYACTCEIFNKLKLPQVCYMFGVENLNHHDGLSDAVACAKIYLAFIEKKEPVNNPENYIENNVNKTTIKTSYHEALHGDILVKDLSQADPNNPFYDKKVVITGIFDISRNDIAQWLKRMGADINTAISRKTNIVLVGEDAGQSKLKTIDKLIHDGYEIKIYHQDELKKLMNTYN